MEGDDENVVPLEDPNKRHLVNEVSIKVSLCEQGIYFICLSPAPVLLPLVVSFVCMLKCCSYVHAIKKSTWPLLKAAFIMQKDH